MTPSLRNGVRGIPLTLLCFHCSGLRAVRPLALRPAVSSGLPRSSSRADLASSRGLGSSSPLPPLSENALVPMALRPAVSRGLPFFQQPGEHISAAPGRGFDLVPMALRPTVSDGLLVQPGEHSARFAVSRGRSSVALRPTVSSGLPTHRQQGRGAPFLPPPLVPASAGASHGGSFRFIAPPPFRWFMSHIS